MQARKKTAFRIVDAQDLLLPEPQRRKPVASGMTNHVIEDAVFEVIGGPATHRMRVNDNPRKPASERPLLPWFTRIAVLATAAIERQLMRLSPQGFTVLLGTAFFAVFWVFGGFSVFYASRATVPPEAGFAVRNVYSASEDANGMKVLAVSGRLANLSAKTMDAPSLKVESSDGKTAFGMISLATDEIGPEMEVPFSGRFKLTGGKSADIVIIPVEE